MTPSADSIWAMDGPDRQRATTAGRAVQGGARARLKGREGEAGLKGHAFTLGLL
jgi:hypothetical protein